ncbi:MAG TPA: integrase arm-type DNA-binding domain-containing protein [Casimicrobiaceae bacterium]
MAKNLLTDRAIRNAKPKRGKDYRLRDGEGLYVFVARTGGKSFQYRYKVNGKGQTVTLKESSTLADARDEAERLRKLVAAGDDPKIVKRIARVAKVAANAATFEVVSKQWVAAETRRKKWSPAYVAEVEGSLTRHLSELDPLPVSAIVARVTAPILHAVERSAPHMEEKVARRLYAIMDFAVELGALVQNPLPRRRRAKLERKHFPAVTDLPTLGAILRDARASDPCKGISRAHTLLAYTAQRPSEVVGATWSEFDLKAGTWAIPRARMKRKDAARGPHIVPLPPALLADLRAWKAADNGSADYVCPAPRDPARPITPEGVEKFYRDALHLQGKHSPHSWRSAFSTICRDAGKEGDVVEAQLDHQVGSKVSAAYDRAARLELRRSLLEWYEATLIAARDGAKVVEFGRKRKS